MPAKTIFISYASEDRAIAQRLAAGLEQESLSVWWDRQIQVGTEWDKTIEDALADAKCVIVLWTPHSKQSRWVRAEAREALNSNTILPVMLAPNAIPLAFTGIQALRFIDWDGSSDTREFELLRSAIRAKLEGNPVQLPEASSTNVNWIGKAAAVVGVKSVTMAVALGALTASALWPITPDITVHVQTTRIEFTVNPGHVPKRLTDSLPFHELTLQNIGELSFRSERLLVANPSHFDLDSDAFPPKAWLELLSKGRTIIFERQKGERQPEVTLKSVEGKETVTGNINGIFLTQEAVVTLEAAQDNALTMSIRTNKARQRVVLSDLQAMELIENGLALQKDISIPFPQDQELTYKVFFGAKTGRMEILSREGNLIVIIKQSAARKKDFFSHGILPIQSVDFSWQDPATGERKSPAGLKGKISYKNPVGLPEVEFQSPMFVTLDSLEHFEITSISLDPMNHALTVDLQGRAGYVKTGTAGNPRDHRPTLFDKIRLSPPFEPIRELLG
jgi:hypothetical protein